MFANDDEGIKAIDEIKSHKTNNMKWIFPVLSAERLQNTIILK